MPENVVTLLANLFEDLLGEDRDPEKAAEFAADPTGTLNEAGLTEAALDSAGPLPRLVEQAADQAGLGSEATERLLASSGRSAGASSQAELVTSVTYVTNEGDRDLRSFTENFTTFDNSTDVRFDGEFDDVDLDIDNKQEVDQREVNADDGGVAVLGDDNEVKAATGEDSVLVDGDNKGNIATGDGNAQVDGDGQANTGAGAVQVGEDLEDSNVITGEVGDGNVLADDIEDSLVNTGRVEEGAVLAGGDLNAPVVTGEVEDSIIADELDNDGILAGGDIENKGVLADGDVEDVVVAEDSQVAQVQGDNEGVLNFGSGADISNIVDSDIDDAAIATGGNATNVSDNEDSAISFGGDSQNISDNELTNSALAGDDASNVANSDLSASEGGAIAVGGDARGEQEIEDSFNQDNRQDNDIKIEESFNAEDSLNTEVTDVDADNSIVGTEQGSGDLDQDEPELEQSSF